MTSDGIYSAAEALWILASPMVPWDYHPDLPCLLLFRKLAVETGSAYDAPQTCL